MNKKIIPIFLFFGLGLAMLPQIVLARIVPECTGLKGCGLCDLFLLITNIYNFIAFKLAPPIAGVLIVLAGALFLTSGGSEERVSQAKKIFVNIILGLIFIYASWLIVNSIIQVIGKDIQGWSKTTWMQFKCN
jgi:hypothetical protein